MRPIADCCPDHWRLVNDDVMGGCSVSRVQATPVGTILFSGEVSLANRGGFASMRINPFLLDLNSDDELVAKVRGDGRSYLLNLYSRGAPTGFSHRAAFETVAGEWLEVRFRVADFKATRFGVPVPAPRAAQAIPVVSLGVMIADGAAGPFSLELAGIWIVP